MSNHQRFDSVWDALEDTPERAANMRLRSALMAAAQAHVRMMELTQREAAARLGLTQPRLNDLLQGKMDKFSLDALVNLLAKAGKRVDIDVHDAA